MTILDRVEAPLLPDTFGRWFASRGWTPRAHQLELLAKAREGRSVLLIAPTGGGKTLAGFLPTLVELSQAAPRARRGLHTLYISPLKALAVDIARNLERPIAEMGLPIRVETRTGDTPASRRQRQLRDPPDILLTTPEQLALLIASADGPLLFGALRRVVLDELHSLVMSKRGDLLSLGLARLFRLSGGLASVGLSATVAEPEELARFLVPQPAIGRASADLVVAHGGAAPHLTMLEPGDDLPWAGHSARHAYREHLPADPRPPHDAGVRQHAQPGRGDLPRAVAGERRQPRHRAASRLARRGAAAQGRGRHGRGAAARGGRAPPRSISASTGATSTW